MGRALPRPRLGRAGFWLLLAGAAGLLAALLTARASLAPDMSGRVVVARAPLPAGTMIDNERAQFDLTTVAVPGDLPLVGVLASPADAVGRRLAAHLGAGEPLTEAALGGAAGAEPAPLAPGERAVAAPLTAAGGAGAVIAPGMRVDVVASSGEGPAGRTAVIVADAEVLAVPTPEPHGEPGEVLLRVRAADALRVTAAFNFSREVRLLIRPADEPVANGPMPRVAAP